MRVILFSAFVSLFVSACSPIYVMRAGWEEAGILLRREPIVDVVENPEVDEETKRKLRLVLEAREFAIKLGLEPKESFTQYSKLDRDVLVWVLSAAPKNSFDSYTWWFPIVGSVPYKGFFDKEDGLSEAEKLQKKGYDTFLRTSPAFSTLGWFNDPILSTTLQSDDVTLVNTVIHEILHSTTWVPNYVEFNETLANVVGSLGACEFYKRRRDPLAVTACGEWEDALRFAGLLVEIKAELEKFYQTSSYDPESEGEGSNYAKFLTQRKAIFQGFIDRWNAQSQSLKTDRYRDISGLLNNAVLAANKAYFDRPQLFMNLYFKENCQLEEFITVAIDLTERARDANVDPYSLIDIEAVLGCRAKAATTTASEESR